MKDQEKRLVTIRMIPKTHKDLMMLAHKRRTSMNKLMLDLIQAELDREARTIGGETK